MGEHTPGTWKSHYEDVLVPEGMTVALGTTGFSYDPEANGYSISKVKAHTNARLIAAAPDLLESLEKLRTDIERYRCNLNKPKRSPLHNLQSKRRNLDVH